MTEFACCTALSNATAEENVATQITFMRAAMHLMDSDPRVFRWVPHAAQGQVAPMCNAGSGGSHVHDWVKWLPCAMRVQVAPTCMIGSGGSHVQCGFGWLPHAGLGQVAPMCNAGSGGSHVQDGVRWLPCARQVQEDPKCRTCPDASWPICL
jgi:hypothetical protein